MRRLRLMLEDPLTPAFCAAVAARMPYLEELEIERCGYHDGGAVYELVRVIFHPRGSG